MKKSFFCITIKENMSKVKHLLIRSKDRFLGTSTDFKINLETPIQDLTGVSLLSVSLPNTFNVTSENNIFTFNDSTDVTITLPVGSYNVNTLISTLTSLMNASGSQTYTISYSSISMKLTFEAVGAFTIKASSLNYILGFDTENDTIASTSHEAINILRLDYPPYLLIEISELYSLFSKSTAVNSHANFIIPMDVNSQSIQLFNRNNAFNINNCYMSSNITTLTVKLKKDDGSIVSLNGGDWSLLLGLIYKE